MAYAVIWEYHVNEEAVASFEQAYNPDGLWVQLFKMAEGFLATELHRDLADEKRYVTVDHWHSKAAHDAFMERYKDLYDELDGQCAAFTKFEHLLGRFSSIR